MDRKSFGKLLAALRVEMGWTQAQLAELTDEEDAVISQVERGMKKYLDPELVLRLANALQLATLERREFFLAASGMEAKDIISAPESVMMSEGHSAERVLQKIIGLLGQLPVPAFVSDVFGDVVAANKIIIDLLQVPPELLAQAPLVPGGYSTLRLNYGEATRAMIADGYDTYAVNALRAFREISLRYRAHPYYQYLMKEFRNPKKYPLFEHFWRKAAVLEDDRTMALEPFIYTHTRYGRLAYSTSSSTFFTAEGELFLYQYTPLDAPTETVFREIHERTGTAALRFAPWPEKKIP
jgi:transcriptional regulator with XRE-family HTH domain